MGRSALRAALSVVGAVAGGVVGYFAFFWIVRQGFYALALPGGMIGAGCGLLSAWPSRPRGIACGVAGLALGICTEWAFAPFVKDGSLAYFLGHLHQLKPVTMLMIVLGALAAYWLGRDRLGGLLREPKAAGAGRSLD